MAYRYRDVQTFPALYGNLMQQAAANLEVPVLMQASKSRDALVDLAAHFTWFRWCLRQRPDAIRSLGGLEQSLQFRTRIDQSDGMFLLYLTAKPDRMRELLDPEFNPSLADVIPRECQ